MVLIEILASGKEEEVIVMHRKGGPGQGLLLVFISFNELLEHCSLETEESQPPSYLDPFPLLQVSHDCWPNEQSKALAFPVKLNLTLQRHLAWYLNDHKPSKNCRLGQDDGCQSPYVKQLSKSIIMNVHTSEYYKQLAQACMSSQDFMKFKAHYFDKCDVKLREIET